MEVTTMIRVRKSTERGYFDHGWLKTHHTFSFSRYHDPRHVRFRTLRVMNEDWIEPGREFGAHPHENMEILTYVLEGALAHRDSLGNGGVIRAGEMQRMSAGTGITHSEANPSETEPVHLYQIWLFPDRDGHEPSYEQTAFPEAERLNRLRLVASPDGEDGSLTIHQDARLYLGALEPGQSVRHTIAEGRHVWLQVARGEVLLNGVTLGEGDGAAVSDESSLSIVASAAPAEVLLFDLA
jgi:redox-sensitive bicupin YhaK (pirin superfamily)